ncbi:MAG: hypothetical protein WCH96_04640 [Betaproteobacteria bacterium]
MLLLAWGRSSVGDPLEEGVRRPAVGRINRAALALQYQEEWL